MLVKGFSHIHPLTNSCRCSQLSVHITQMESQYPTSCSKACPWRKDSKARGLRVPFLLIPLNALSIWNLGLPLTSDNVSNGSLLLYNYIYRSSSRYVYSSHSNRLPFYLVQVLQMGPHHLYKNGSQTTCLWEKIYDKSRFSRLIFTSLLFGTCGLAITFLNHAWTLYLSFISHESLEIIWST